MPADITVIIDERQIKAAQARLAPERFDRAMSAGMGESTQYIKGEVQQALTPYTNTGMARGSIFAETRGVAIGNLYGIVGSPLEYVGILAEWGRKPGSRMPPVEAIQQWAARKLGDGSRGTAFIIARAIGRRGLPARHIFSNVAQRSLGVVARIFSRHLRGL